MKTNNLSINEKEYIYIEKYRPTNVEDIVLPETTKQKVREWIKDGEIPNLLLSGKTPGTGKTSLCHTIIHELDADALFLNASLQPNIDMLRSKIQGFVSTSSFDGRPKIVVLDEADFLNAQSTQPALRGFIESFSKGARFILTCNYKSKLIEPLRNRLIDIDFDEMSQKNKAEMIKGSFLRAQAVLDAENIVYTKDDLIWIIKHFYPSSRKILNQLQEHSTTGTLVINKEEIDSDSLALQIITDIKNKNFNDMRKNIERLPDPSSIYGTIYDNLDQFKQEIRPNVIIVVAKYAFWDSAVRDRLVNAAACGTEVMEIQDN